MSVGLRRDLPHNVYEGAVGANSPSSSNVFATMADISSFISPIYVNNFSEMPDPTTVSGAWYHADNSQGTRWLPFALGGTYYPRGLYYSNGVEWIFTETPSQATLEEVRAGIVADKFVGPDTLKVITDEIREEIYAIAIILG